MNRLLKTEEVAEYLSIPLRTAQHLIKTNVIPSARIGRAWRVEPTKLQNYLYNAGTPAYKAFAQQGIKLEAAWQA